MKFASKMMKMVVIALALSYVFVGAISVEAKNIGINETNFPDPYFIQFVELKYDKNKDGLLSDKERNAVKKLDIGSGSEYRKTLKFPSPGTLEGIEYFPELKTLICEYNDLSSLDVSKNNKLEELHCDHNKLEKLDVHQNKKLKILWCDSNNLKTLDVSQNRELKELWCGRNQISKIKLNKKIETLELSYNQCNTLNVKNLKNLDFLSCDSNEIKKLDVSKNKKLEYLHCGFNKLKKLDVTHNPRLTSLYCSNNKLRRLDLSNNKRLNELNFRDNYMITGNLGVPFTQMSGFTYIPDGAATSKQRAVIKPKKIGKYYYIPLSSLKRTRGITKLSAGVLTEKGIRLKKGKIPEKITYKYNMFTNGKKLTKVEIQVKK